MKLPRIAGDEVVRAWKRTGFVFDRQHGSDIILGPPETPEKNVHPRPYRKTVKVGTLGGNLDDVGLSAEEFIHLL
jgi:predicted RNA binding protein YcfA (HicA-like mRNA interferase family)